MRYISGDSFSALLCSVIFTLCQYHLDDIYIRSAVGEYTAYIFMPLLLAGCYDLIFRDFRKPWLFGAGMAGVLLCHTLSTVFCTLICVFSLLLALPSIKRKPKTMIIIMATAALTLAATAFYWIPMLEQVINSRFQYGDSIFDLNYEKLLLREVFRNKLPGLGLPLLLLQLPGLFVQGQLKQKFLVIFADFCAAAGLLFALCSTGFFPWARLGRFLSFIQFPWRLFLISSVLLSFSGAIFIAEWLKERTAFAAECALITVMGLMLIAAQFNFDGNNEGYYSYSDDYFSYEPYTETVIGGEWLPQGVKDRGKLGKKADTAYTDEGEIKVSRQGNRINVENLKGSEAYIDLPFIYYLGYGAFDAESGRRLKADGTGENGRLRVYPEGAKALTAYYTGTALQAFANMLSIAASLFILVVFLWKIHSRGTTKELP